MNTIRIRKHIESDTIHVPELKEMIGKTVEIIIRDEARMPTEAAVPSRYDAFFALAGQDVVDPSAYKALRTASMI